MKRRISLTLAGICLCIAARAQKKIDTVATYSISAYADVYYAAYSDSVGKDNYQKFPTVSPRSNNVGLNIFQVSGRYDGDKIRCAVTLHWGDIPNSTWAPNYKMIQEAHFGYRVLKTLWIDAGFFRTHFGTEYLLPVENITSSVAVATTYEPYYEAGVKLNYDPTPKLEINLFLLNGYGIYEDNNNKKSIGMGVTYNFNENLGIGYTNYLGDDAPVGAPRSQFRIAQNFFLNYNKKKIKLQFGDDLYLQANSVYPHMDKTAAAFSVLETVAYKLSDMFSVYERGEMFYDDNGFMTGIIRDDQYRRTGYKLWSATAGLECKPIPNSYIRLEGRYIQANKGQRIFYYNNEERNNRFEIMVNAGISLNILKGYQTKH